MSSFQDIHEYPVSTATYKAVEVYERLVVSSGWICNSWLLIIFILIARRS